MDQRTIKANAVRAARVTTLGYINDGDWGSVQDMAEFNKSDKAHAAILAHLIECDGHEERVDINWVLNTLFGTPLV